MVVQPETVEEKYNFGVRYCWRELFCGVVHLCSARGKLTQQVEVAFKCGVTFYLQRRPVAPYRHIPSQLWCKHAKVRYRLWYIRLLCTAFLKGGGVLVRPKAEKGCYETFLAV